jgi:hypothetical protein
MKRILIICFLVGSALAFLTGKPTNAYAQSGQCPASCQGAACLYYGNLVCQNGQYMWPALGPDDCNPDLPPGCQAGSGGYDVMYIDQAANCQVMGTGCQCPFDPTEWYVYGNGC